MYRVHHELSLPWQLARVFTSTVRIGKRTADLPSLLRPYNKHLPLPTPEFVPPRDPPDIRGKKKVPALVNPPPAVARRSLWISEGTLQPGLVKRRAASPPAPPVCPSQRPPPRRGSVSCGSTPPNNTLLQRWKLVDFLIG